MWLVLACLVIAPGSTEGVGKAVVAAVLERGTADADDAVAFAAAAAVAVADCKGSHLEPYIAVAHLAMNTSGTFVESQQGWGKELSNVAAQSEADCQCFLYLTPDAAALAAAVAASACLAATASVPREAVC